MAASNELTRDGKIEGCNFSNKDEPGRSFYIDSLLRKPEPPRNGAMLPDFPSKIIMKQVCPMLANIAVPQNLFLKVPAKKNEYTSTNNSDSSTETGESFPSSPSHAEKSSSSLSEDGEDACGATCQQAGNYNDGKRTTEDDSSQHKKKRPRTAFSVPQVKILETEFERNRYLTSSKRKELSKILKLSETQIKIWFQNRRTKLKRKNVSDMESWVQQLYSPMGPMAPRPLVIGDQLYLFSTPDADTVLHQMPLWRPGPHFS